VPCGTTPTSALDCAGVPLRLSGMGAVCAADTQADGVGSRPQSRRCSSTASEPDWIVAATSSHEASPRSQDIEAGGRSSAAHSQGSPGQLSEAPRPKLGNPHWEMIRRSLSTIKAGRLPKQTSRKWDLRSRRSFAESFREGSGGIDTIDERDSYHQHPDEEGNRNGRAPSEQSEHRQGRDGCWNWCQAMGLLWVCLRACLILSAATTVALSIFLDLGTNQRPFQALAAANAMFATIVSTLAKVPREWSKKADGMPSDQKPAHRYYESQSTQASGHTLGKRRRSSLYSDQHSSRRHISSSDREECPSVMSGGESTRTVCSTPRSTDAQSHRIGADRVSIAGSGAATASFSLQQQRMQLEGVAAQLEEAEEMIKRQTQLAEDQQALLRGFRRIIRRDVGPDTADSESVMLFVVEKEDAFRHELKATCRNMQFKCKAFASISEARMSFMQSMYSRMRSLSAQLASNQKDWRAHCLKPDSDIDDAGVMKVVLLGASWLTEWGELPREFLLGNPFVVLVCKPEGFLEVSKLVSSTEFESQRLQNARPAENFVRSGLQSRGIADVLIHPVSLEDIKSTIMEALHQRYSQDYLLMEQVGQGAFAMVHKVKRMSNGQVFALKEIHSHKRRGGATAAKGVDQESEILKACRWPTVVFLVDAWTTPTETRYLLMPLMLGGDLGKKIIEAKEAKKRIQALRVFQWYLQALHAIAYLHWRGVLHTDIKPANLLLAADGRLLQVGDLGSAILLPGGGPHPSQANLVKGDIRSRLYSCPATLRSNLHSAGTDIWAMGATFFEIIALRPLVESDNLDAQALADVVSDTLANLKIKHVVRSEMNAKEAGPEIPSLFVRQLPEMLTVDRRTRPSAAALLTAVNLMAKLREILWDLGAFEDRAAETAHFRDADEMIEDDKAAWNLEPPFLQAEEPRPPYLSEEPSTTEELPARLGWSSSPNNPSSPKPVADSSKWKRRTESL